MIKQNNLGGRVIELFIPFDAQGAKITQITLAPFTFGHTLRWQNGEFATVVALLVEMAGCFEETLRGLRYPDADRVLGVFFEMLPAEIRAQIQEGRIPVRGVGVPAPAQQSQQATVDEVAAAEQQADTGGFDISDQ